MQPVEQAKCDRKILTSVVVLFLHGSGDSGPGFRHSLSTIVLPERLAPEDAVLIFPSATERPYTPMMGRLSTVWFDRPRLHYDEVEDSVTLAESILALEQTLKGVSTSFTEEPILYFVGFSMGGSMALHLAFHFLRKGISVHGVFVHSSFIGRKSQKIFNVATNSNQDRWRRTVIPRLFFVHGSQDTKVPCEWGQLTVERLRKSGFSVEFMEIEGLRHEISAESLSFLQQFLSSACSLS